MWSTSRSVFRVASAAAILGLLLPVVLAHGDDGAMGMDMDVDKNVSTTGDEPAADVDHLPTYFSHAEHRGVLIAHIALMVLAWVVALPLGESLAGLDLFATRSRADYFQTATMFSLARSRYTLPTQFAFLATNALGVLCSTIYNANTPDLYPNNAHHKLGWLVTWVLSAQALISLLGRVAGAFKKAQGKDVVRMDAAERRAFIPVTHAAMDEHHRFHIGHYSPLCRHSNDSGQGTEPNTESLRSSSFSSNPDTLGSPTAEAEVHKEFAQDDDDDDVEADLPAAPRGGAMRNFATKIGGKISSRAWNVLILGYNFVDRTSMILGFITLATGIIAMGRFFVRFDHGCLAEAIETDISRRRAHRSSPALLIGSRAASFSGWAS